MAALYRTVKPGSIPSLLLTIMVGLVLERCAAAEVKPGTQVARKLQVRTEGAETTVHYWLFLPEAYDSRQTWPLLLFLHGAGERGNDLDRVTKWGPPRLVADRRSFPFVVVSPQCPRGKRWEPEQLRALVEHVAGARKIDRSRLYCTGLSMGGYGTWQMVARYPDLFAAAVPICGGGDPATAQKLVGIPIWAFHGDADRVVPVSRSRQMVDAVRKAGGTRVRLTVYPGVDHNSWHQTYASEKTYEWLLSHTTQAGPADQ